MKALNGKRGRPLGTLSCLRDERGWLIPTEGTKSRICYDMLVQNRKVLTISKAIGASLPCTHQMIYRIKHPDIVKDRQRNWANERNSANVTT